jgi:hypothetical protein
MRASAWLPQRVASPFPRLRPLFQDPELSRRTGNGAQHARAWLEHEEGVLGHAVIRIDLRKDHCLEGNSLLCVARRAAICSIEAVEFRLHGTRRRDVSPRLGRGHVSASFKDGDNRDRPAAAEDSGAATPARQA